MDWQEEYKRKLTTPEEAVKIVKSGDRVAIGGSIDEPQILPDALFERRGELRDVKIIHLCPMKDYGWGQPGYEESFQVEVIAYVGPVARQRANERRISLIPNGWRLSSKADERADERKDFDVFMVKVSSPSERGYCCFGTELWLKKDWVRKAKKIIAEVDSHTPWVYGDSWIHVSEVDYFVEHTTPLITDEELPNSVAHIEPEEKRQKILEYGRDALPHQRPRLLSIFEILDVNGIDSLAETVGILVPVGLEGTFEAIASYVNLLLKDRDCFQIGQGSPSAFLPRFGAFAGKEDLGYHAEMTARGVATLVREGQITGKYKNIHTGRALFNSFAGMSPEEVVYATENPSFEVHSASYVTDPRIIAMHDNMVAINNALSVDLTGQINAEVIFGSVLINGPGGQPDSHLGALLSKGGRAISVMRSTVMGGTVSTIVPQFEPGTVVTVGRQYADYIVTEYGIAKLMNKNFRERADELISVAHPDFRAELRKEAQQLFWP
jgi:4-hydroxybutyrate CoA-transferase